MRRRATPAAISPQWSIVARSMASTISLPALSLPHVRWRAAWGDTIRARGPLRGRGNGRYVASRSADNATELRPARRDQCFLVRWRCPLAADLHRAHPGRRHPHRLLQFRPPDRTGDGRRPCPRPAYAHPRRVAERPNGDAVGPPPPLDGG